jgi:hypothetical protein
MIQSQVQVCGKWSVAPSHIECLPEGVLELILNNVFDFRNTRQTGRVRHVSKSFRNAHDKNVINIDLTRLYSFHSATHFDNTAVEVVGGFVLTGPLSQFFTLSRFTSLEEFIINKIVAIGIYGPYVNLTPTCFELLGGFTRLRSLEAVASAWQLPDMPGYLSGLSELSTLNLAHCFGIQDVGSLAHMTRLETLQLSYCRGLNPKALRFSLSTAHHHLTVLIIFGLKQAVNDALMEVLMDTLPVLEVLNIGKSGITDLTFTRPITSPQPLRILKLAKCLKLTDLGLLALSQRYTALEELDLRINDYNMTSAGVVHLGALKQLKKILLRPGCQFITVYDFDDLVLDI